MDYMVGIGAAAIMLIWLVMILSHSWTLQRFGVLELVLMLVVSGSMLLGYSMAQEAMTEQYFWLFRVHFGGASDYLGELETNEALSIENTQEEVARISGILTDCLPVTTVGQDSLRYRNLAVVKGGSADGFRACFAEGENPDFWNEAKREAVPMISQAALENRVICQRYGADGALLVLTDWERITPVYAVVAEISLQPLLAKTDALLQAYVLDFGVLFVVFSILTAVVVIVQGRELGKVIRMTVRVSEGKEDWSRLKLEYQGKGIESDEMRSLYNSLWQLASDIERMHYVKFKMLQAYYRFAPKQIERLLQKESILDVGDTEQIRMEGTLAFVSFMADGHLEEQDYLRTLRENYTILGAVQKEYDGVLLSADSNLRMLRILFYDETKKAFAFGVELSARAQSVICLHRASFVYGVVGDDGQAFPYIHSEEMNVLERYADAFWQMGVRMVVTDCVHEACGGELAQRYIGFLEEGGFTFHIYEVLDAYSADERHRRIALKPKFQKALELFYGGDAYLARNMFSEILRDCPADEVAKWYVFVCERCLNADSAKKRSFALFSGNVSEAEVK